VIRPRSPRPDDDPTGKAHLVIGLVGNLFFVLGSIMFLYPASTRLGTWFFIIASWGLLIGVLGEIATRYEARRRAAAAVAPPA
jgi:hypothetical protein